MNKTYSFVIEKARTIADGHVGLTLSAPPPEFAQAHIVPGQYATMKVFDEDEKARPLAFASEPGSPPQFIFRTPDVDAALKLQGATRALSAPTGAGFGLPAGSGQDLWLIATGSAIGPVWTQLQAVLAERKSWGKINVLYGALSPAHLCFRDAWPSVIAQDVDVTFCLTTVGTEENSGARPGRVQLHLPAKYAEGTHIVVCGHWDMMNDVVAHAGEHGVPAERVHKNF